MKLLMIIPIVAFIIIIVVYMHSIIDNLKITSKNKTTWAKIIVQSLIVLLFIFSIIIIISVLF
jgi:hypothetical protein